MINGLVYRDEFHGFAPQPKSSEAMEFSDYDNSPSKV